MARVSSELEPGSVIRADDGVVVSGETLRAVGERVLENLPRYFPADGFDDSASQVRIARLGETSSYPIFLATVTRNADALERRIVIKFAPVFAENNEGLTEHRHLEAMYARLGGDAAIRVPRPLDFYADLNALLMEQVGGERFSRVILRDAGRLAPRDAARRLCDASRLCGEWLAAYHGVTGRGDVTPFDDDFVGRVEEKLATFRELGFHSAAARRVSDTLARLHAFGRGRRVPLADQHGDYGPQNVHLGESHVYVFDLNYHATAPVFEDIGYYLVTLETLNPYPRQWLLDRSRLRAMREPFLAGYFENSPADPARDLYIEGYYLKSLLFRCAKQRRNTAKRGRAALSVFDAVRVRRYYPGRMLAQCERVERLLTALDKGAAR